MAAGVGVSIFRNGGQPLRTSPSIAHAQPAPVIGIRLFDPSPPGLAGREVIGHEPSSRCVSNLRTPQPRILVDHHRYLSDTFSIPGRSARANDVLVALTGLSTVLTIRRDIRV